jgi:hypothetical protein
MNHRQVGLGTIAELSTGYPGYDSVWPLEAVTGRTGTAALGGVWIDIIEMLEIRLVLEVAVQREPMPPVVFLGVGLIGRQHGDCDQKCRGAARTAGRR